MDAFLVTTLILGVLFALSIKASASWKRLLSELDIVGGERLKIVRNYRASALILLLAAMISLLLFIAKSHFPQMLITKIAMLGLNLCLIGLIFFHGSPLVVIVATMSKKDFRKLYHEYFYYFQIPAALLVCIIQCLNQWISNSP